MTHSSRSTEEQAPGRAPGLSEEPGPLQGVRVVDLTRVLAGGHASVVLADLGADVIKVERPGGGDEMRLTTSGLPFSPYFETYSRNKRSIVIDLKTKAGRDVLLRMVESSDILVENFRPGTLEKLKIGPDVLLERNPSLVIVRISGWGQSGPYAERPGFGTLAEAVSGFMIRNGYEDRPPAPAPIALADMIAGLYAAATAAAAIFHVHAGGDGQVIDVSLFEPLFSMMGPDAMFAQMGVVPERGEGTRASSIKGTYLCSDGKWLAISAATDSTVDRLLASLGRLDLLEDPRFSTYEARLDHRSEMNDIIQEQLGVLTRELALGKLHADGVTAAPLYDVYEAMSDPHFRARGVIVDLPSRIPGLDTMKMHGIVPHMSRTPSGIHRPAPRLGEHTREVLNEFGYTDEEISRLATAGTIEFEVPK